MIRKLLKTNSKSRLKMLLALCLKQKISYRQFNGHSGRVEQHARLLNRIQRVFVPVERNQHVRFERNKRVQPKNVLQIASNRIANQILRVHFEHLFARRLIIAIIQRG